VNKLDIKQAAKVMKALSHPHRLEIYLNIVKGEQSNYQVSECSCSVTDFIESLKIGAPTVSHHLKELVNAGLIITEKQGKYLTARPIYETWEEVKRLMSIQ